MRLRPLRWQTNEGYGSELSGTAGTLREFARSFVFDNQVPVERIFDTAELCSVGVANESDARNLWQVRVKELLYFNLKLHLIAGPVSDSANGFSELG